jgi:glycosyltransferase involved in cell wall biosynthesis
MKVLHVYKDFDPPVRGGMERHMALMCRFQRQWAEVEALTCSRSWRSRVVNRDETRVTEVAEWGRFQSAPVSPLFPGYLRRAKSDVIVIHTPFPTAEIAYLLAQPPGKLVVRYQSDVVRQAAAMKLYGPIQMKFLRKADMIVAASPQYVDTSAVLSKLREKCRVIPLGIVPEDFAAPDLERVESIRASYGGDFVLFSGRHRYYKGLEYLIGAANRIRVPVVVAGDGPERQRCETLARGLRVPVVFRGTLGQQELVNHLHACALFVYPSVERSEAFGIAILEAHACAKPVVATRLGTGIEFTNLDGKTGVNVPPRDPEALADAINRLLDDPGERSRMGAFAQRRVQTEFRAEDVAKKEFELFQELLG